MKLQRGVFLDFDGVLFDTVKEAYLVCFLAVKKISKIEEIDYESQHFEIFSRHRYLIGPAWNYLYLLKVIEEVERKDIINLEEKYLNYIKQAEEQDYRDFEKDFLIAREYLKKNYKDFWLKLNTPYNFFFSLSALINKHSNNFFVVTTKDKDTVLTLLKINGQVLNHENIYDRESFKKFKTKFNIIKNIIDRYSIENAIFVDDNRFFLSECDNFDVLRVLQPKWGYISPGDNALEEKDILSSIKEFLEGA